jgi:DNA topoisomerase-1
MSGIMIVESPNKVKKITHYLHELGKSDIEVVASVGHIRDLPENELGVDTTTLVPTYVVSENKTLIVAKLKKAVQGASEVYLATDPDREGESISWHLYDALGIKRLNIPVFRVRFNEINKKAIGEAITEAGKIDMQLVYAQEARRVLDRLVGYLVSPRLGSRLSAGRVQSPALRLIVDREDEIENFKPITYYDVAAHVKDPKRRCTAFWVHDSYRQKDQEHWLDEGTAQKIATVTQLKVVSVEQKQRSIKAPAPFTTSSLQQAASIALGFAPDKTMDLAQNLFAQGAISYHRTDCPNLSGEAINDIVRALKAANLPFTHKPNTWPSKSGAQEAHEAIHPSDYTLIFAGETEDEQLLYELIKQRALACQMPDAIFDVTTVSLEGNVRVPLDTKPALFKMRGEVPTEQRGWMALTQAHEIESIDPDTQVLPVFQQGELVDVIGEMQTKKTKPPGRYTEASLVKKLESFEIGRPSTYASIIANIKRRDYVVVNKKRQLEPTEKGKSLIYALKNARFSFMEYDWTREIEQRLDAISLGQDKYKSVVFDILKVLEKELIGLPETERGGAQRWVMTDFLCQCGGRVEESDKAYQCQSCKATVWKVISNRPVTREEAALLFDGEQLANLEGFISKSKKPFAAGLKMNNGKAEFYFDDEPREKSTEIVHRNFDTLAETCLCGGQIVKSAKNWTCNSCGSRVWNIISGRTIRESEALKLLKGESIDMGGFASSTGRTFNAEVSLRDKKVVFKFL